MVLRASCFLSEIMYGNTKRGAYFVLVGGGSEIDVTVFFVLCTIYFSSWVGRMLHFPDSCTQVGPEDCVPK